MNPRMYDASYLRVLADKLDAINSLGVTLPDDRYALTKDEDFVRSGKFFRWCWTPDVGFDL